MGDYGLIPVAVARDIPRTFPVLGSFVGESGDFIAMTVGVEVSDITAELY
jgi:hypothetical protein